MLSKRVIVCLDVKDGRVVKGVGFRNHQDLGDVSELAQRYVDQGADELVLYDITASPDARSLDTGWIRRLNHFVNIPFCVAGGISTVSIAEAALLAGADKISVNSPALRRPELINELSETFGSQAVVVGIDSLRQGEDFTVWQNTGRADTAAPSMRSTRQWLLEVQERGAGEVVLNCMNRDGVGEGFDILQLQDLRAFCLVPLIASGGAGCPQHFHDVFTKAAVEGALAAGMFHRGTWTVSDVKKALKSEGIPVREIF